MPKIYDCFPFFNELDILEIRLNELDSVVDYFVISELPVTHSGKPKPLYFAENKERFAKFLPKIIHIVGSDYPTDHNAWSREQFQRNLALRGLEKANDNDIVIVSDVDEIPRASSIKQYNPLIVIQAFEQKLYSFYLNCCGGCDSPKDAGVWSKILPCGVVKQISPCGARYTICDTEDKIIRNGGWHFNYMGGAKKIIEKFESWAHQEWNKDQFKDADKIANFINNAQDPWGRPNRKFEFVQIDNTFPQYIRDREVTLTGQGYIYTKPENMQGFQKIGVIEKSEYKNLNQVNLFNRPKIYDCFMFFNELDLLEIRLNELDSVVDQFVLVEARKTHTNKSKPLYFEENKARFAKFLHKITHLVIDEFPSIDAWKVENYQRCYCVNGLRQCKDSDIIILSDMDEIPKASTISKLKDTNKSWSLEMRLSYYYVNCICDLKWTSAKMSPFGLLKNALNNQELIRWMDFPIVTDAGWHFSFLGGVQSIIEKIEAWSHQEYNNDSIKNAERLKSIIKDGKDIFSVNGSRGAGAELTFKYIPLDESFPLYLIENKTKFSHFIEDHSLKNLTEQNEWLKKYDTALFDEVIEQNIYGLTKEEIEGHTVIDAGGNIGLFTVLSRRLGAKNIYTIEANPNIFPILSTINSETQTHSTLIQAALYNSDEQEVNISDEKGCSTVGEGNLITKTISLPTLLKKYHINDKNMILKMDIEGSESEVLLSVDKETMDHFDVIHIEIHKDNDRIKDALYRLGFNQSYVLKMKTWDENSKGDMLNEKELPVTVERWERRKEEIVITVGIPTRNRYDYLAHTVMSIAMQTVKPLEIIIVDDSDTPTDLRELPFFTNILHILDRHKINWRVIYGRKSGPHHSHQIVQEIAQGNWIFRIDDDEIAEPNVLEKLIKKIDGNIGAIAPLVLLPGDTNPLPLNAANIITDMARPNLQWFKWSGIKEVEHLYSCFLYRKNIAKYELSLSQKGYREESLLTHEIYRKGYKLLINGDATVWHCRAPQGGIRA